MGITLTGFASIAEFDTSCSVLVQRAIQIPFITAEDAVQLFAVLLLNPVPNIDRD